MKAIVRHKYGSPDVLELQEVETPPLPADQVMIRVHAASVNQLDWHFLRGTPFVIRMTGGLVRPKRKILGADVAGPVEAVGATVMRIQPGDDVFAASPTLGTFAEYLCVPQNRVALKPVNARSKRPRPYRSRRSPHSRVCATRDTLNGDTRS